MTPWARIDTDIAPTDDGLVWVNSCYHCDEVAVKRIAVGEHEGRPVWMHLCPDHEHRAPLRAIEGTS